MRRWAAGVDYDGSAFFGWQSQPHAPSVQAEVEQALTQVAAAPVRVACAGRTDAGVHSIGQVIHFDSASDRGADAWVLGANTLMPPSASLRFCCPMPDTFHARYSATSRAYRYVIYNRRARSAAFARCTAWWRYALDAEAMHVAAQALVGEHDFSAFRAANCQSRTPVRRLLSIRVWRSGDFVSVQVRANAFVYNMVRNIVGTLIAVGQGKQPARWVGDVLAGRDRRRGGVTAPAEGLYFIHARYDPVFALPPPSTLNGLPGGLPESVEADLSTA